MVITDGQKVYLYRIVERVLEPEWTWTADAAAGVFAVQLADLDGDGVLEVVVNRYHPNPGILLKSDDPDDPQRQAGGAWSSDDVRTSCWPWT